jgi:nucleotide-binding universal stress UspA family protein
MSATTILEKPAAARIAPGYRDLVVQAGEAPAAQARLALAARLAQASGGHLTAVLAQHPPHVPGAVRAEIGDMFLQSWRLQARDTAARVAAEVAKAGRAAGVEIEFRTVEGPSDTSLMLHARHADVAVIGQAADGDDPDQTRMIESLLFGAGRPVLIVPARGRYETAGRHVMCAWNASRESARAIADAMPLLRAADKVTVLSVDPDGAARRIAGADIALHLARNGVEVTASVTYTGDLAVGDAILNRAADLGADLLVMGGYGHSRAREAIFGGATRHVLDHMTLPVLMSH